MNHNIVSMFNATAVTLRIPADVKDRVHRYVRQHQGSALLSEQAPFRRQLDLWAAGIAVACAKDLEPRKGPSSQWGSKFVDTRSVNLSQELAEFLVVIAAAEWGLEDQRLGEPQEVAEIANQYAAAGIPIVLSWLEDPGLRQTNLEKTISGLRELGQRSERALLASGEDAPQVQGGRKD